MPCRRTTRGGTARPAAAMHTLRCLAILLLPLLPLLALLALPAYADESLEQLVAAAPPGATVSVPAGVHAVQLKLEKPVTLVGEPGAILDGGGAGDVVRIGASNVTVRGLTLRHSGSDLTATNAGIFVERQTREVTLEDNRIEDSLFGIYLDGAANVRVAHNVIRGMRNLRVADRGDGIHLWNDTGCTIEGNDVAGSRDGIYVYVSSHNTIARNVVHDVRYGVHYMYSQDNLLLDNVSRGNLAGYALMSSHHLKVLGNSSEDESSYGFLLNYIAHSEIAGNRIYRIKGQSDDAGGTIDGTEGKGLFVYLSQFNDFHRIQVKYVQNLAQEWSAHGRGNFWSDYLGWDLDADGIGDVPFRPNDGVDVLLWKYPSARNLMSSPSVLLMRYVQRAFPVFTPPSVQDSHPLMKASPAMP